MRWHSVSLVISFVNIGTRTGPTGWLCWRLQSQTSTAAVYLSLTRYCIQAFICTDEIVVAFPDGNVRRRAHTQSA